MSQHPLDSPSSPVDPIPGHQDSFDSYDSFPPLTDDDLSSFERKVSSPFPFDRDNIVRAQSPFGRRYLKPINGIQIKGFARSAQRRSSVLTLGSIERLQNFYANKELKVNKGGTLGFQSLTLSEEPDDMMDQLPTPQAPPPSWINLDVETDLDVLLKECFNDIQTTLTTWSMVTGPNRTSSSTASSSDPSESEVTTTPIQILPLLSSVTDMLSSIKNYSVNRHDLSNEAVSKLRHAALDLLEAMKELETQYRIKEEEDLDGSESNGFLYMSSDFDMLERERKAIHKYLEIVEKHAFNPPHHIGSPPAVFTPEIKALMGKTEILSLTEDELVKEQENAKPTSTGYGVPEWLQRSTFNKDPMGRYHSLISDNLNDAFKKEDVPDPKVNEDAFLEFLADGIVLCNVYNSLVKRSKRPFGLITKIHSDSKRTYRAIENLRFFSAACKFRFELVFDEFDPSEIARKTDKGLHMLSNTLTKFCNCVIREFREHVDSVQKAENTPK